MKIQNKNKLYGILAVVLIAGLALGLGFIFDIFWKFNSTTALTCYWVIKSICLLAFVGTALLALLSKSDKSMGAFAVVGSLSFLIFPLFVRLLVLIPGIYGVIISYVIALLMIVGYLLYVLLLGTYANNNTDTEIQTEYKETNYDKYKKAQENIEKQKNEKNNAEE